MSPIIVAFIAALLVSMALLPTLARILPSDFLIAAVNARSNHTQPARQIGGLAVAPAAVTVICLLAMLSAWLDTRLALAAAGSAGLLAVAGYMDDRAGLAVSTRLGLQFAAALGIAMSLDPSARVMPEFFPLLIERTLTVGFLIWVVNMTNFMDGLDLMIVSGVGVPHTFLAVFGLLGLVSVEAAQFSGLIAGALLGFAWFNLPPARLFLGDSGSLSVGLLTAVTMLIIAFEYPLLAVIPFLYFFIDSLSVVAMRLARHENIFEAHSMHAYQIARRAGWSVLSVGRAVSLSGVVCVLLFAIGAASRSPALHIAVLLAAIATAGILVGYLRMTGQR